MRALLFFTLLALGLVGSHRARADVIDPDRPPLQCDPLPCPEGSSPAALGHSSCPSVCRPNRECQSAADCADYGEAARCEPTRFCITIAYSGPGMSESVADACEPSGPCGTPDPAAGDPPRCSEVSRCVAPPAAEPPAAAPTHGGCAGCAVAPSEGSAALAPIAIALLLLRRRLRSS